MQGMLKEDNVPKNVGNVFKQYKHLKDTKVA